MNDSRVQRGPKIVNNGLILHLDAANLRSYPGSGTTWYDLTKYKQDFPLTSPNAFTNNPTFSTEGGGSFSFVSSNKTVITSSLSPGIVGSEYSISAWFKSNGGVSFNRQSITNLGQVTSANKRVNLFLYYTNASDFAITNDSSDIFDNGNYINTNLWYNLTLTLDSSFNGKGYVNGSLMSNNANFGGYYSGTSLISLGARQNDFAPPEFYSQFFDGYISNFMIYNRALTADEVQQNFSTLAPRFGYY